MKTRIRKLLEKLNAVPKDKYQHFAVGAVLAAVTLLTAWALFAGAAALLAGNATQAGTASDTIHVLRVWVPLLISVGSVLAAALVKERRIDARADLRDLLATLAGGAAVWVAAIAAYLLTA